MSPEMEVPKLLWLKRHLPVAYRTAARFLDLADFLTYRATGAYASLKVQLNVMYPRQRLALRVHNSVQVDVLPRRRRTRHTRLATRLPRTHRAGRPVREWYALEGE